LAPPKGITKKDAIKPKDEPGGGLTGAESRKAARWGRGGVKKRRIGTVFRIF